MTEKAVSPESRWYLVASLSHCPVDGPVAAQGLLRIKTHQKQCAATLMNLRWALFLFVDTGRPAQVPDLLRSDLCASSPGIPRAVCACAMSARRDPDLFIYSRPAGAAGRRRRASEHATALPSCPLWNGTLGA